MLRGAVTIGIIAVVMTVLPVINRMERKVLISFALVLYAIAGVITFLLRKVA